MARNPGIDVLRAGAARRVFVFDLRDGVFGDPPGSGWVGVMLFFVLSGRRSANG